MLEPRQYAIRIEPDLNDFTFQGKLTLRLHSDRREKQVVLNARELSVRAIDVRQGRNATRACTWRLEEDRQELLITLPEAISGEFELLIEYAGCINDQYAGLYRSQYHHDGRTKFMASTQFEASDARRAFPCFDRPDLKAIFDIEMVIDQEWTAISNTAILTEKILANGKKRVRFQPTPRMSTYLVFFGVGEFEFLEDASAQPLVRVATAPGKREFGRYALDMGRKSLAFGETYLDIPYPLSKCDYIAMPDSMGAMENFGAIRHAEDVLLVYPGVTSKSRQTLIAKIIAHESIHMWFGDLVSPASWKYLWLNEAFATYFTYVIPHHYYPDWGVWEQFFPERMLSGLARDALAGSVPIDLPEDDDPAADPAPTPSTAPIVYNKGAAVIRMLEAYLGEAAFRQALHDFLTQYQFAAATSGQFWDAVARSAGVSLQAFARTWIHQPGHPLVTVERTGETLHLHQRRFGQGETGSDAIWVIPVDILFFLEDGSIQERQVILDDRSLAIDLPEGLGAYKLNAGFTGFYRVQYPEQDWQRLGGLVKSRRLSSVDSLNVLDDLFALLTTGAYSVSAYLQFVEEHLGEEDRYLPLTDLARNLERLYLVNDGRRAQISALGLPIFERALDEMHWDPQDSEPLVTTELRETLLWAAFVLGSTRVADFALSRFQEQLQGESIHPDLVATLLKIGAALHPQAPDSLWAVAVDPEQTEADRIMALQALGNLPVRSQQLLFLDKNLAHIPNSLQSHMIQACARSLTGRDWLWDWFSEHLPRLEAWPLTATERLLVGVIPLIGIGRRAEAIRILDDFADRHPRAGASMQMALELLTINQHLR